MRMFSILLLSALMATVGDTRGEPPPNIIYVMVDDLGPADLGCFGSTAIQTPHLDRMADEGLQFTQAYSGCTVCAPCRSVLLTGIHMGQTSVRLNTGGVPLRDRDVTIAEVLQPAGYRCGGFGKWGVGDIDTDGVPEKQGFDLFYGYYHQIHAHNHWPDFLVRNGVKEPNEPRRPRTRQGYAPDMIFDEMMQFIVSSAKTGQPFFAYGPWTPPHGGYGFPQDDPIWALYKDRDGWSNSEKGAAAMTTLVDRYMGEIFSLLSDLGIEDTTIVFFQSDNGAALAADACPNLRSSGPFRGSKRAAYEGGVRAPMLVRWKNHIAPGVNDTFILSSQDTLPTLAELAGATAQVPDAVTGLSFAPVLFGKQPARTHAYHYWEWAQWDWGRNTEIPNHLMQGLRKGNWKLVRHRTDKPWELYDLSRDIGETNDLAAAHPEQVKALAGLVDQARVPMRPQREPAHPPGKAFN